MTAYYASDDSQMSFDASLYHLCSGTDLLLFPRTIYLRNHQNQTISEDSLISITHKKIECLGTKTDPYLIYDGYDMMVINDYVKLVIFQ